MNDDNEKTPLVESVPLDSRRGFIKYFLFGSALAWGLSAFYGFLRFITPKKAEEKPVLKFVDMPWNADIYEHNNSVSFRFGERLAILIRGKAGKFNAYFATCPHLGCMVHYNPKTETIVCPCHDGVFDLNGNNVSGPPTEPLAPLVVHVNPTNKKIRVFLPGAEKE